MGSRSAKSPFYDPSIRENLERIRTMFRTYKDWDYELIKFDYTSWDIFQRWGFQMMKDGRMSHAPNQ
jgi:alpha-galactosidase